MHALSFFSRRGTREALWLTVGFWTLCYWVFLLPTYANDGKIPSFAYGMFASIVAFGALFSALLYLAIRVTHRLRGGTRVAVIVACVLLATLAQSVVDARIILDTLHRYEPAKAAHHHYGAVVADNFLIYLGLYGLYAAALGLMLSGFVMRDHERQLAEAKTAAHQAQLAALRFQLNPHFLFNTLNAISSLIVTHRNEEAEAMMAKLSDFLRSSLASDPQSVIPLQDELASVQAYLDIESVRFGERLSVEVVCPDHLAEALTPSFVLQPLVENAVKYAVAPARRPVKVRVQVSERDRDLQMIVEDDGEVHDADAAPAGGAGVGLENVRRRLEVLYGERGRLDAGRMPGGGFRAAMRFPLERSVDPKLRRVA